MLDGPTIGYIVIGIALVSGVVGFFVLATKARNRQQMCESGRTPIYTEICGARMGPWNATYPFVRIAVYPEFLVLAALIPMTIPFAEIRAITSGVGFSRGIGFTTSSGESVVIWTFRPKELFELLQSLIRPAPGGVAAPDE